MCGLSTPQGRLANGGGSVDLQVVEFKGLGRGRGFRVVARRSARDDERLRAAVLDRARAILSNLDPEWVGDRQAKDIELLRVDLSRTQRQLEATRAKLAAQTELVNSRDRELRNYVTVNQQWRDHAVGLQRDLDRARGDVASLQQSLESKETDTHQHEARWRRLASRVETLLEAVDPVFQKAEYVAMDDEPFQEAYEAAEEARASVRRVLGDEDSEESAGDW